MNCSTHVANAIFLLLKLDQLFRRNHRHFRGSMNVYRCIVKRKQQTKECGIYDLRCADVCSLVNLTLNASESPQIEVRSPTYSYVIHNCSLSVPEALTISGLLPERGVGVDGSET